MNSIGMNKIWLMVNNAVTFSVDTQCVKHAQPKATTALAVGTASNVAAKSDMRTRGADSMMHDI